MTPGVFDGRALLLLLLLIVAVLAARASARRDALARARATHPASRPRPTVHRCHGAHCPRRGTHRDWHIGDQAWVWSCPGCHQLGHYMGWLAFAPISRIDARKETRS